MQNVFMPINERLEGLVVNQSHLLIADEMPPSLLALCTHVEAYRGVVAEWRVGHFTHSTAPVNYPTDVLTEARRWYAELKRQQVALVRAGA
jgi:hypothetical protein